MSVNFTFSDIKFFLEKNKKYLFWFFISFVVGVIIGIVLVISSNSYLSVLSSADKVIYDYMKGNVNFSEQTSKLILNNILFQLIIFALCLNFYSGLFSFVFVSYQSASLILSIASLITEFGFSGILITMLLIVPINIIVFSCNILFASICLKRSYESMKYKNFLHDLSNFQFWIVILTLLVFNIVFSFLVNLVLVVILKSRTFIIF